MGVVVMPIELDPLSPVPIYQQIRDRIVEAIGRGEFVRGDGLLSVRQLAASFAINPATAAKAYDLLRAERLVVTNAKSGTVVTADPFGDPPDDAFRDEWSSRLFTLLAEARAHGLPDADLRALCLQTADRLRVPEEER